MKQYIIKTVLDGDLDLLGQVGVDEGDIYNLGGLLGLFSGVLGWDINGRKLYIGLGDYYIKLNKEIDGLIGTGKDLPLVIEYINNHLVDINGKIEELIGEEMMDQGLELDSLVKKDKKLGEMGIGGVELYKLPGSDKFTLKLYTKEQEEVDQIHYGLGGWGSYLDLSMEEECGYENIKKMIRRFKGFGFISKYKKWYNMYKTVGMYFPIGEMYRMELGKGYIIIDKESKRVKAWEKVWSQKVKEEEVNPISLQIIEMVLKSFECLGEDKYKITYKNMEDLEKQIQEAIHSVFVSLGMD